MNFNHIIRFLFLVYWQSIILIRRIIKNILIIVINSDIIGL